MQNNQTKIFFTTKVDGNLAFHVGDAKNNVLANHKKLAKIYNYNPDKLIHMKQVHSDIVHIVNEDDNFDNPPTCDALVTNKINTPLMVMVADCTPVIFNDANKGVIAVAHVGREGAFKNIIKNTIMKMIEDYACDAKNIYVNIGASIGECCYEVGEEIYDDAKKLDLEYSIQIKDNNFYLNISKIINRQLKSLNILNKNIVRNPECSCCMKNKYYSYRAKPKTGRYAGVIELI